MRFNDERAASVASRRCFWSFQLSQSSALECEQLWRERYYDSHEARDRRGRDYERTHREHQQKNGEWWDDKGESCEKTQYADNWTKIRSSVFFPKLSLDQSRHKSKKTRKTKFSKQQINANQQSQKKKFTSERKISKISKNTLLIRHIFF